MRQNCPEVKRSYVKVIWLKTVTVARLLVTVARIPHTYTVAGVGLHVDTTAYVF